jgi:ribosome-binding protein aMBF1 (putative translation factor)
MFTFNTPKELIQNLAILIEKERTAQSLKQEELAQKASIPLPTYKSFLYQHKISLENVFKLLFSLQLHENIEGLLKEKSYETLDEIKNKTPHPKRVRR